MSRDHNKLHVFRQADALVLDVYDITRALPPEERFGLQAQIRRAAVSIPTNLVEGAVRRSDAHFLQYVETALGSACETRYLVDLTIRLKMLSRQRCSPLIERYTSLIKGLVSLITRIADDAEAGHSRAAARPKQVREP
jgi:four helix bundle protein